MPVALSFLKVNVTKGTIKTWIGDSRQGQLVINQTSKMDYFKHIETKFFIQQRYPTAVVMAAVLPDN